MAAPANRYQPIGSGGLARYKGVVRLATCLRPSRLLATLGLLVIPRKLFWAPKRLLPISRLGFPLFTEQHARSCPARIKTKMTPAPGSPHPSPNRSAGGDRAIGYRAV